MGPIRKSNGKQRGKEQQCPIEDKDKNNLIPRMQSDKGTYILIGLTLSQNFQENQKRMQRHIYYVQMTGWKPHHFDEDIKVQRFCLTLFGISKIAGTIP